MQDFLKDRPVISAQDANIIAPAAPPIKADGSNPFARIVRDESVVPPLPRPAAPASAKGAAPANPAAAAAAAHTSQVKTVVENGRVARLVVTCSCGKVTEIACAY
jgi:hypothetical protein